KRPKFKLTHYPLADLISVRLIRCMEGFSRWQLFQARRTLILAAALRRRNHGRHAVVGRFEFS
ncbi:MAG: hypothetical protein WA405_12660, partial [Candidatus Acidiferrales bacterium]